MFFDFLEHVSMNILSSFDFLEANKGSILLNTFKPISHNSGFIKIYYTLSILKDNLH